MRPKGLLERLSAGESIVVAEGYVFEMERLGYCKAGSFCPEVVLDNPELLKTVHRSFVHAGSDVVLAYTYYGHRAKLRLIGREDELEALNLQALRLAREVADDTGTLMAGNICNSTTYKKGDPKSLEECRRMNKECVEWAVQGGADFIVGETYIEFGEAMLALEAIKQYGKGIPAVITMAPQMNDELADGVPIGEACRKLEEAGAAVVGLNCFRGPTTILEPLRLVKEACKGPIACLPVPYRCTKEHPTFYSLNIPGTEEAAFPLNLQTCLSTRDEIKYFAEECKKMGIQYIGLCCGNSPHFLRIVAEVYGKSCPALKYAPEMHKHVVFGKKEVTKDGGYYTEKMKNTLLGKRDA